MRFEWDKQERSLFWKLDTKHIERQIAQLSCNGMLSHSIFSAILQCPFYLERLFSKQDIYNDSMLYNLLYNM